MGNSLVILMEYLFVTPDGKTILSMPFQNSSVTLPTLRPSNNVPLSFYYEGKPVLTNHRCYWLNVASLILGFVGNFFLLMNFTQRVRYIIALPMTIFLWYIATGLVSAFILNSRLYHPMNLLTSQPHLLKSRLRFMIIYILSASSITFRLVPSKPNGSQNSAKSHVLGFVYADMETAHWHHCLYAYICSSGSTLRNLYPRFLVCHYSGLFVPCLLHDFNGQHAWIFLGSLPGHFYVD